MEATLAGAMRCYTCEEKPYVFPDKPAAQSGTNVAVYTSAPGGKTVF